MHQECSIDLEPRSEVGLERDYGQKQDNGMVT